ncbi:ABC transporter substrate-binding protein [Aquibium sp. A9E412]|uniref:ABC transporter substrate-binding protein n=1 Tax=Aquibium sp. A9E412 TaxID=2976767 RepID=UPI0025AFB412|nr:ABC transporter substrate-binding protein [Aquibium sp. A9E412]MDN2567305.1 ABC transporter substrate-binding protein [Aquibium sp. A9E412]
MPFHSILSRRRFLAGTAAGAAALALPAGPLRAQAERPFRIGALNPLTGPGSEEGAGMLATLQATARLINEAGGIDGRMFEVISEDDQTKPEAGVLAAKKLVEINKVDAILGTWSSSVTLAVMSAVTQPNDVMLFTCSGAPEISEENTKDLVKRFTPTSFAYGVAYARIALKSGYKRAVGMHLNNSSGKAQIDGFVHEFTANGGEFVDRIAYEPSKPSYRSELQTALASNPDCLVLGSYLADTTIILREAFQLGSRAGVLAPHWALGTKLVEAIGAPAVEGVSTASAVLTKDNPSVALYDRLYREAMGEPGSANAYGAMCYDMVNVLAYAIAAAGPGASNADINGRIREVANSPGEQVFDFVSGKDKLKAGKVNYSGASSLVEFDERGDDTGGLFSWDVLQDGKAVQRELITL